MATLATGSFLCFLFARTYLYSSVVILGRSMEPTLQEGSRHLVNRWYHRVNDLQHGDLVLLQEPDSGIQVVKRLVGLPGETIQLRVDGVYRNSHMIHEPYVLPGGYTHSRRMGDRTLHLGPQEFFVMGDNRLISLDSRWYGPISHHQILGLVRP